MPPTFSPMQSIPGSQMSPEAMGVNPIQSQPQPPGTMGMGAGLGSNIDQQAGLFSQLEQLHESLVTGKQLLMAIAQQFPMAAEPVRNILTGIDAVSQGMPTLVTTMTSQAQEPYQPSPMVMG